MSEILQAFLLFALGITLGAEWAEAGAVDAVRRRISQRRSGTWD